jgi:putative phosphoribosyl transferase
MTNFTTDTEHSIIIPSHKDELNGILHIPKDAPGLVLFVHGSGSSRLSVRNQYVARVLNEAKLATLLFDLLTPEEDAIDNRTREFRFDIDLLASRLINVTHWCLEQLSAYHLTLGYFGASTGAAAAIIAAGKEAKTIKAVVSRGGRPDLAGDYLVDLQVPTLLIVGGLDETVIAMNKTALAQMKCVKKLELIPGASHLFEESGTLDKAAELAREWFIQYLT